MFLIINLKDENPEKAEILKDTKTGQNKIIQLYKDALQERDKLGDAGYILKIHLKQKKQ